MKKLLMLLVIAVTVLISCQQPTARQMEAANANFGMVAPEDFDTSVYYYNGEILLPDYVHSDTLVVTDAAFLNKYLIQNEYEIASDGDISDILCVATKVKGQ